LPEHEPIGPQAILAKKQQYLIPCSYHFYRDPPQIVRGQGIYVFDSGGRRYMDLYSGVSVHALGHCHPEMVEAICRQVGTLQHTSTIYLTEPMVNLAEQLARVLPGPICRTFFCCSGSEANEGAALLATLHTGRSEFLAFQNGLHGRTKLGMSLTGLGFWRTDPNPVGGIVHVPPPFCRNCPFGQSLGQCQYQCVAAVETAIRTATSGKPAAMFVEPVQGNGGIMVPPPEYFPKLREVLNRYSTLLVADEVQTGFGRTGRMFALEHWNVTPDILTGGKALGGGTPVGFFSTTDDIAASYTRPSASTFGGNPVTAQAGLKLLEILQRDMLVDRCARMGTELQDRLKKIAAKSDRVSDVRGLGLMVGVQIAGCGTLSGAEGTDRILERMKDRGYLLGKTGPGRNVLTWMPPLIVRPEELMEAVDAFEKTLQTL
jgi:4-aminobutyrate aminotransferase-like enzyme